MAHAMGYSYLSNISVFVDRCFLVTQEQVPTAMTAPCRRTLPRRQLLNHVVDRRAKEDPEVIYAEYPISATGYDQGFLKITYKDLANAINGLAWWLHNTIGPRQRF